MKALFWICLLLIAYPYVLYPLALVALNRLLRRKSSVPTAAFEPTVTIILPVHNEAARIATKVTNLLELDYPRDRIQILIVGDGCTDDTLERARAAGRGSIEIVDRGTRAGKAAALNAGLARATGEIVVFTDAGIMLECAALRRLVGHFNDPAVGCVSGEDRIEGGASEGLYGRLELLLRREEARLHSIAGASGCFYGQRRALSQPFTPGMAPDFLSVLVTVARGQRAVSEAGARGSMTATVSQRVEFERKARTLLRGITALFGHPELLNPFRYPAFSFILWSHKVMRWLAPLPIAGSLVAAWALRGEPLYAAALYAQFVLYAAAAIGLFWPQSGERFVVVRLSAFFLLVNAAALHALCMWLVGARVEVWQPTRRPG